MSDDTPQMLGCMEVRGGITATDERLSMPGLDAWIYCRPHDGAEAGGDIHYVSSCFTGRVARFALADVSGHGPEAAKTSELLRDLMRKHVNTLDQTELAQVINAEFEANREGFRFATALLMAYFAPEDKLIVCNAGHPRPLWFRAARGGWQLLDHAAEGCTEEAPNNLPLGVITPTEYHQFAVALEPHDVVVLYSDALIEQTRPGDEAGEQIGQEGLLALAADLHAAADPAFDPRAFGRGLLRAAGDPDADDVTLIVVHHDASEVPFRPMREAVRSVAQLLGLAGD